MTYYLIIMGSSHYHELFSRSHEIIFCARLQVNTYCNHLIITTYFLVITRSSCAHDLIHGAIFILPCHVRGSVVLRKDSEKKNLVLPTNYLSLHA